MKYLSKEEYDEKLADFKKRYGYDERSDNEKAAFDKKWSETYAVKDEADAQDSTDSTGDTENPEDRGARTGGRDVPTRDDDDDERW